jgi:hypothetical protein
MQDTYCMAYQALLWKSGVCSLYLEVLIKLGDAVLFAVVTVV